eukprot:3144585-Karenia_brevis.AAC.1
MLRAATSRLSILKKATKHNDDKHRLLLESNSELPHFKRRALGQALPANVANAVQTMSGEVTSNNIHHFQTRMTLVH